MDVVILRSFLVADWTVMAKRVAPISEPKVEGFHMGQISTPSVKELMVGYCDVEGSLCLMSVEERS